VPGLGKGRRGKRGPFGSGRIGGVGGNYLQIKTKLKKKNRSKTTETDQDLCFPSKYVEKRGGKGALRNANLVITLKFFGAKGKDLVLHAPVSDRKKITFQRPNNNKKTEVWFMDHAGNARQQARKASSDCTIGDIRKTMKEIAKIRKEHRVKLSKREAPK